MNVRIQEEYLNLHAMYLEETSVQCALADVQQEKGLQEHEKQEFAELSMHTETEIFFWDMKKARRESENTGQRDEQTHIDVNAER